jgi:branched-chain amino acid transport system ATP-binding protein
MLALQDIHVSYGSVAAARGCTLEVGEGELVALVGPNGAGKSTLLNTIAGVLKPAGGTITFEGESIAGRAPEALVDMGIALVPQGRRIFGTLTVAENLQMGGTSRRDRDAYEADLAQVLADFPVCERYYQSPADRLSGGEQQQVAIARALLSKPRLLLLDEPSFGLAPLMIKQVFETLARLKSQGVTILLVEQAAERAMRAADRSYVMRTGKLVFAGDDAAKLDRSLVADMYLGGGGAG